jgi:hypothetical protein
MFLKIWQKDAGCNPGCGFREITATGMPGKTPPKGLIVFFDKHGTSSIKHVVSIMHNYRE